MKALARILFLFTAFFIAVTCFREEPDTGVGAGLPDGTPITLLLNFDSGQMLNLEVGTKAAANGADEARVHDLYVMIFDGTPNGSGEHERIYNRFFSYEHLVSSRETLLAQNNEGWFVDNVTLSDLSSGSGKKTRGVVKLSTVAKANCTIVVLANIKNTLLSLNGSEQPVSFLDNNANAGTLEALQRIKVKLVQEVTTREDLFLMMGKGEGWNTGEMAWDKTNNTPTGNYGEQFKIELRPLDAKVKFRIKADPRYIESVNPRLWRVYHIPEEAYLYPNNSDPSNVSFFDTADFYFEGTESDTNGNTWNVFTFYMLQNRQPYKKSVNDTNVDCDIPAGNYHRREYQEKEDHPDYDDPQWKKNGDWVFAGDYATYVKFDIILYLTTAGITEIQEGIADALTTDAIFTVHLGDFTNSGFDNYETLRGCSYTYNITIQNSKSIYVEVMGSKEEDEPGQEGSLLLTTTGIINCDAHYEYHTMVFNYNSDLVTPGPGSLSWYLKTPFNPDGCEPELVNGWYAMPENCDGRWVMFTLNDCPAGTYATARKPFPGYPKDSAGNPTYYPEWYPGNTDSSKGPTGDDYPRLMDINQLVNFLFWQNKKKKEGGSDCYDSAEQIRVTAYVNEYYYEVNPFTGELDQNLWRKFVNALPRELHILSDANHSYDRQSNVVTSSHSIIQQSIQTIYNIYSPSLSSIWGTEHNDILHKGAENAGEWAWWPEGSTTLPGGSVLYNDDENGRLNTAGIWGVTDGFTPRWDTFLNYSVDNDMPELRSDYRYLAYACMARNRDNNGNGLIDEDEVRWYTASINQLVGMWVGNEALTQTARLYQPRNSHSSNPVDWRSEVVSSTVSSIANPRVIRAEEGATKSDYNKYTFWTNNPADHYKVTSIRCLRNIGTYREKGVLTDISYVPTDRMVDQYYECELGQDANGKAHAAADGTYTILFSRLNSMCIREYTTDDLPYHDEFSLHNCVYLRFTAQNMNDHPEGYGDRELESHIRDVNDAITIHDDYCPEGYRLPNMTELLLMSAVLPNSYWTGVSSVTTNYPCRTYFSRGVLGDQTLPDEIGWAYSIEASGNRRVHMINKNTLTKMGFRCVRDDKMIGDITGGLVVENGERLELTPNASNPSSLELKMNIELDFFSLGSAIEEVDLWLYYTDPQGRHKEKRIKKGGNNYKPETTSTTLREFFTCDPILASEINVYGNMSLHAIVRNAYGTEREFDTPIHVLSDLRLSLKLLPVLYDKDAYESGSYDHTADNTPFPLLITAYNIDANYITSWSLKVTSPAGITSVVPLDMMDYDRNGSPDTDVTYASRIYSYEPGSLQEGTYTFQLEAVSDGKVTRSETVSMNVLHLNYQPNGTTVPWWERQMIQGLDFGSGDFIETDMDVTECVYNPVQDLIANSDPAEYDYHDTNNDRGFENILSIGLTDAAWTPYSIHFKYPSRIDASPGQPDWLYPMPVWNSSRLIDGKNYKGFHYSQIDNDMPIHIRLESNGIYINGKPMDVSEWGTLARPEVQSILDKMAVSSTIYLGAVDGNQNANNQPRVRYRFVRVVYNGRDTAIHGGDSNFGGDPVNGGDL